jgi:hypothetical protein
LSCRFRRGALLAALSFAFPVAALANGGGYIGLLRARDLSPFGFLRLDMRPAHAVTAKRGAWAIETELAYQNTWALSPQVERYLSRQPGRRALGPTDLAAIRALPGENYLVDLELAQLDVTLHYKFASRWGAYATLSGVTYQGGFLDSGIEEFHDVFGFSTFGRRGIARDKINILFDLKSLNSTIFDKPTTGGYLDPIFGFRYSGARVGNWHLVGETAIKTPVGGRRSFLSSGRLDAGLQISMQRFSARHAVYVSAAAVYYDGSRDMPRTRKQVVPTLVAGYERRLTDKTHLILQGYASSSVYSHRETDLNELLENKYQLSLGAYHRRGSALFSFALTENLQNLNNTPDIGFQMGWAYSPALKVR